MQAAFSLHTRSSQSPSIIIIIIIILRRPMDTPTSDASNIVADVLVIVKHGQSARLRQYQLNLFGAGEADDGQLSGLISRAWELLYQTTRHTGMRYSRNPLAESQDSSFKNLLESEVYFTGGPPSRLPLPRLLA